MKKRLFLLIAKICAGEKTKKNTTLGQVMGNIAQEGMELIRKRNLTPEEDKRMAVLAKKSANMVELMTLCADIDLKNPGLARSIANS